MTNNTSMTIRGSSFIGNQARLRGGAVYASRSSLLLYSNNFTNNYASAGGALSLGSSMLSILGEVHFLANKAKRGGAIYMFSTNATFNGSIILSDNSAVLQYGGAMCINRSSAIFIGNVTIKNNTGGTGGGIYARNSLTLFQGNCSFFNNRAVYGGGLLTSYGTVSVQGPTLFSSNEARIHGGALYTAGTIIEVKDKLNFTNNSAAVDGGAMNIDSKASLSLLAKDCSHPIISSSFNSAKIRGGLIYREDSATNKQCEYKTDDKSTTSLQTLPNCFLQISPNTSSKCPLINSHNDSAGIGGSVLYGGMLDRCRIGQSDLPGLGYFTDIKLFKIRPKGDHPVTSRPYELCICGKEESSDCVK